MSDVPTLGDRERIARVLCAAWYDAFEQPQFRDDLQPGEREDFYRQADAVLAVLPSPAEYIERLADDETAREAVARSLAELEPGEDWPTNEALGGSMTGTRDDEYRDALNDQAADAIRALAAALPTEEQL